MKGLFSDQVITVIDEETIVWGISCYKKISELVDVDGLEKCGKADKRKKHSKNSAKDIPHIQRHCSWELVWG